MATTTGTTRATTTGSGWCAAESEAAGIFSLRGLWQACEARRRRKRRTRDAQRYDQELLDDLVDTQQALATGQWRWFVREWPGLAVLVQTGHRFELHNDQARDLARWFTVALDPVPRQSFTATLSAPLTRLQGFRRALRQRGIAHLFLAEEGFLPGGLKRSVLRLAWWPEHPQPGLLPDHPGEST